MAGISYVLAHTEDARRVSTRRLTYAALALVAAFLCFIVLPKPAVAANYPVTISATTFPDEAFRQYVINNITGGSMTLTQTRAEAVSYIGVISRGVNTLRGIEFFPNLKTLDCDNNNLTALDLSKNTALTLLACQNNNLASLDVSKNIALGQLACSNNNLTSLDLSKNTALTYLSCENNNLASLNISKNIALRHLICSSNNLTALDVSKNTALMYLFCGNNKLTSLDVSRNTVLTSLFCYDNNLTALDLSKNTALTEFNCSNNNLTSLDVSKNTALDYLFCRNNNLTSLDVSKNTALRTLSCYGNSLIELDLSKNPNLRTDVFLAIAQTRTIPLIPDPASPGSYMSKDTYTFAAGHSITVASATYRTDTKRFYTSTPNKALTFTTNIGSGRTVSGTVTFTDTTAPKLTANTGTRSATATGIAKFTSDEAGTYYYAVVESGATAPTINTSTTGTKMTAAAQSISLTNLSGNTAKDVYIKAKDATGNISNTIKVVVPAYVPVPVKVTGVTLNATTKSLEVGLAFTLVATVTPTNATNKAVVWTSSDTKVATVGTTGKVTAVKVGKAVITVTTKDGAKTAICTVTVKAQLIPNATYIIRTQDALSKTKAIDIQGASTANGAKVQIWEFNNTPAQRFSFTRGTDGYYTIRNINSNKVLDVAGGVATPGCIVNQYTPNGTNAQKWRATKNSDGSFTFSPRLNTSLCLDIQGGSSANGAVIQLYAKNSSSAQRFKLAAPTASIPNGIYTIGASYTNKVLDVSGASTANGANIQLWTANNTSAQRFRLTYNTTTGYYTITNLGSGKVLDVDGARISNGSNVWQWEPNNTNAQRWVIEKVGTNYRFIAAHSGLVLDAAGAGVTNGTNVWTWAGNGTAAQVWKLVKVG